MFKPMDITIKHFKDVPLFELTDFTMYELTPNGLETIMLGSRGTRYSDRYVVKDMNYTDNSKKYIANIVADLGIYKNEIVTVTGHVAYRREDGLTFKSQKATYNKKTADVISDTNYIAYLNDNVVTGDFIKYNNITKKIYSKNVVAKYQLKKEK